MLFVFNQTVVNLHLCLASFTAGRQRNITDKLVHVLYTECKIIATAYVTITLCILK